jgi:hypothetical protein
MIRQIRPLTFFLTVFLIIFSCSSEPSKDDWEDLDGEIYIGGYEDVDYKFNTIYWKDGKIIHVPIEAFTQAICLKNNKLFILGNKYSNTMTGRPIATYFVDGKESYLNGNVNSTWTNAVSMYVDEAENIYIAGSYGNEDDFANGTGKPCFWVNGTLTDLPGNGANCTSITVSDGVVYISGSSRRDISSEQYGDTQACYWVNNVRYDLSDGNRSDCIYVSDGNIYVLGNGGYWLNGVFNTLSSGSSDLNKISVYQNKVYIIGSKNGDDGLSHPCYWIDSVPFILPTQYSISMTLDIAINADKVVIVGSDYDYYTDNWRMAEGGPCYWINGVKKELPKKGLNHTQAVSVALNY